jgi:hypothetical protein
MEHSLHLAAHHFVTALNVKMKNTNAGLRSDDLSLTGTTPELSGSDGVREEDEVLDGQFQAGDVLGKILAFTGLVS